MKTIVVGVGGMTNGGKSTLSKSLHQQIPNSCLIAQDSYFKDDSVVPVDSNGFKQYDMLDALHMDRMMSEVDSWRRDPETFLRRRGLNPERTTPPEDEEVYVLIVEGFLIFNHRPLNELFHKRYSMEIPYDVCKTRRSSRVYTPPDAPGYFDGHVWPMYLKHRQEMESSLSGMLFLDGLKPKEELLAEVYEDVCKEIKRLRGKWQFNNTSTTNPYYLF
ncbi:nicotinamide riboside kinase 1 [Pseudoliparis swirei]|uniref:nicotinamide riboside kinase 1 n=1 Tax=Pseudoliparis swirei TaxID=2059687 RepID=UPI0024BDA9FD|nr:nicotinamide riboside kinase 1 [Pseudoliparis swirei]